MVFWRPSHGSAGDVAVHWITYALSRTRSRRCLPSAAMRACRATHGRVGEGRAAPAAAAGAARIARAAVVVPVFLLPAQRLLRAAPGARGDGCLVRPAGGVPPCADRLVQRARHRPAGLRAAV